MSRDVCSICWCPYGEDGNCGCKPERAAVQAAQPEAVGEPNMASPEYRSGWNAAIDLLTRAMMKNAVLASAPAPTESQPAEADERSAMQAIHDLCIGVRFLPFFDSESEAGKLIQQIKDLARNALVTPPSAATPEPSDAERVVRWLTDNDFTEEAERVRATKGGKL